MIERVYLNPLLHHLGEYIVEFVSKDFGRTITFSCGLKMFRQGLQNQPTALKSVLLRISGIVN